MTKLHLFNDDTKKYQNFKNSDGKIRSTSLSARAGKGSVVSGKENYSKKHDTLFEKFMKI